LNDLKKKVIRGVYQFLLLLKMGLSFVLRSVPRVFYLYLLLAGIHLSLLYLNNVLPAGVSAAPLFLYFILWGILVWFFPLPFLAVLPFLLGGLYWISVRNWATGLIYIGTSLLILWRIDQIDGQKSLFSL